MVYSMIYSILHLCTPTTYFGVYFDMVPFMDGIEFKGSFAIFQHPPNSPNKKIVLSSVVCSVKFSVITM